jgi:hypothetical protein
MFDSIFQPFGRAIIVAINGIEANITTVDSF